MERPALLTFDIFGTVLDWKRGLEAACVAHGRPLREGELDRIIDLQGELEQLEFDLYTSILIKSLATVIGLDAAVVADGAGRWPLFDDSPEGLRRLLAVARCAALTNSDTHHAPQIQERLGFHLSDWICAEEVRHYKPRREIWDAASERIGVPMGPSWWHVSAYSDYDLAPAQALGLTTVFVGRPHSRPGPSDITVPNLRALAALVEGLPR